MCVVNSIILLADDWEDDIFLTEIALKKARISNPIHVVRDGEQCLAYLRGDGEFANREEYPLPSLLLLDLKMPRINGLEVLRWIRAQSELKPLRVVVLSSSLELSDMNQAYQLGANSFLVKPTDLNELVAMMQALDGYCLEVAEESEVLPGRPLSPTDNDHHLTPACGCGIAG
jgi:CheY-like chemotaxis protein